MIEIDPNYEMTTGQVAGMIGNGMTGSRVNTFCSKGLVPYTKKGNGPTSHYRIKFKDLDKVLKADEQVKKFGRDRRVDSAMDSRIIELTERVDMLQELVETVLASTAETR